MTGQYTYVMGLLIVGAAAGYCGFIMAGRERRVRKQQGIGEFTVRFCADGRVLVLRNGLPLEVISAEYTELFNRDGKVQLRIDAEGVEMKAQRVRTGK